ncbi:hypothetical protein D9757_011752 [Collybiopsis confluens]|uniref:Aminoglycoside phosphotransferase domain-containing protein n=1 Tax=Collybiopsis confluens TaxID=2823264 RepID=A0A8H5G8B6_9AGAR|nr:hypothetical protein D9757_011752 [Collybiopsis confluens]
MSAAHINLDQSPTSLSSTTESLVGYNGNPPTKNERDSIERQKCVDLFRSIRSLYPDSSLFGPLDTHYFRFPHGDLHESNILVDPNSGEVTAYIDWDTGAFRPSWATVHGAGWFNEDKERHLIDGMTPAISRTTSSPVMPYYGLSFAPSSVPKILLYFPSSMAAWSFVPSCKLRPMTLFPAEIQLHSWSSIFCWVAGMRDTNAWRHMLIDLDEKLGRIEEPHISG